MEYLYCLANASLTLRLIEHLHNRPEFPLDFLTVVHHIDRWIVKIKIKSCFNPQQEGNFKAFLDELGFPAQPPHSVKLALRSLETGQSPITVMHHYRVVIVSHGSPKLEEIEVFRQQFIKGLGYCPQHLA